VTEGDVERIAARTGGRSFFEHRVPADAAYAAPDPDDPSWLALTVRSDGTRRVLKRGESGDCTFLGARGCVLREAERPLVCRLYPFSYSERGLDGEGPEYCPTTQLAPNGGSMVEVLGMRRSDAERWHAMLYAELRHGRP
jgi:Fe-S-cluster containining protein